MHALGRRTRIQHVLQELGHRGRVEKSALPRITQVEVEKTEHVQRHECLVDPPKGSSLKVRILYRAAHSIPRATAHERIDRCDPRAPIGFPRVEKRVLADVTLLEDLQLVDARVWIDSNEADCSRAESLDEGDVHVLGNERIAHEGALPQRAPIVVQSGGCDPLGCVLHPESAFQRARGTSPYMQPDDFLGLIEPDNDGPSACGDRASFGAQCRCNRAQFPNGFRLRRSKCAKIPAEADSCSNWRGRGCKQCRSRGNNRCRSRGDLAFGRVRKSLTLLWRRPI
mmetsp:Transcript_23868/g.66342  ORF Transcript_23868/g.66342 Transcript_23868/m.66342 type:complete len:283 (-) Transcript_23868:292-1140(-)